MKIVWPNGTNEDVPDVEPSALKPLFDFCAWFTTLSREEQKQIIKALKVHILKDKKVVDISLAE